MRLWRQLLLVAKVPHRFEPFTGVLPETNLGDLLFVMGAEPKEHMESLGLIPKKKTVTYLRETLWPMPNGAHAMFSFSCGVENTDYGMFVNLVLDTRMAIRYCQTGTLKPVVGDYRWVEDFTDITDYIQAQYAKTGQPVEVSADLETLGLNEYDPTAWIITIFFSAEEGKSDGIAFQQGQELTAKQRQHITWLLNTPMVSLRGANLKYDVNWMVEKWGIHCTNFRFDTLLVGSLLDENRSNSLNIHAKLFTPIGGYDDEFNAKYDKSRMDLALADDPDGFKVYAGGDTDACLRVARVMKADLLSQPGLCNFYINILHPAARAYEKVQRTGVLVNTDVMHDLHNEIVVYQAQLQSSAREIVGARLYIKHCDDDQNLNLQKASFLKDFFFSPSGLGLKPIMFTEKAKAQSWEYASTSLDHLRMFGKHPKAAPLVKLLEEYSSASKTLSTYVDGFMKHLRPDSRFHPSYFFYAGDRDSAEGGTVTGRLSAKDPAFQTIPKHTKWAKKLRRAYIAPEGYVIMGRDYSQGELKIAACVANEQTMIQAYLNGIDLHAVTASRLAGYGFEEFMALKENDPDTYDAIRQLGKAGNFGLLYGMGPEGFMNYAQLNYGVDMNLAEATENRNAFFELYTGLPEWHNRQKRTASTQGRVVSPLGRIRHLPLIKSRNNAERSKAERQSINSPVQATLSDMALWATALWDQNGYMEIAPSFGMVHDALYFYVPADEAQKWYEVSGEIMENLPFHKVGWSPQLQFTSDAEFGYTLDNMKKVKGGKVQLPDPA